MKRSRFDSKIKKIHPLFFWAFCNGCKQEFRREKGFRYTSSWSTGSIAPGPTWTLCGSCGPDFRTAKEEFLKLDSIKPPRLQRYQ